jgi:hypothetical protein
MFVRCCHCLDCQRQAGSAFVINALIEADRVVSLGAEPRAVVVPTDSGRPHRIFRADACQVACWSEYGGRTQVRFVRAGTLDRPAALAPDVHIFVRSKLPWVALAAGVPAFDVYYETEKLWPAASLERRLLRCVPNGADRSFRYGADRADAHGRDGPLGERCNEAWRLAGLGARVERGRGDGSRQRAPRGRDPCIDDGTRIPGSKALAVLSTVQLRRLSRRRRRSR